MKINVMSPPELGSPFAPYSQIAEVPAGRIVFIAGQVASDRDGNTVGADDFDAQCKQVFANIKIALDAAGLSWENVAQFTSYLISEDDIEAFKQYRDRAFPHMFAEGRYPTNTLLIVKRLVKSTFRLEVQATAAG
jgi:enamine deaminase RidA (YjgF/YER057c/UK114 family)